jgi:hypothetical protein
VGRLKLRMCAFIGVYKVRLMSRSEFKTHKKPVGDQGATGNRMGNHEPW